MARTLTGMASKYHEGCLVGHISRDSTATEARETPVNTKKDVKQVEQKPSKSLLELNKECTYGCKKNSQGNIAFRKGYKLHLDITDQGIPITALVTGANVHDSQVAIPMEKLSGKKVQHLYSLMDSAYDAVPIHEFIRAEGRVPLIDPNICATMRCSVPGCIKDTATLCPSRIAKNLMKCIDQPRNTG